MRNTTGRKRHIGRSLFGLLLAVAIGFWAWNALSPMLATEAETSYEAYTATVGDVLTTKSFSASLDVLNSETHTNTSDEVTSIREVYVEGGQSVQKNDKLLLLKDGTLFRAGLDGVVNDMRFGRGDWVWRGVTLVQVVDLEHLQVTLMVDEYDIDKVAVGQTCTVTLVALDLSFEAEIAHINRVSTAASGVAYYEVTAELPVPPQVLPGMTASVTIPSEEARGVTTLDMAALSFGADGQPYVLLKNGESYEERVLQTGLADGMHVEIQSGLAPGDVVYKAYREEQTEGGFSPGKLYRQIVGEKVVINDRSGAARPGAMPSGQPPMQPSPTGGNPQ